MRVDHFSASETSVVVRPADIDRLGHVNHAKVLEYFELARVEWMHAKRLSTSARVAAVVSRIDIEYMKEMTDARYTVATQLIRPPDVDGEPPDDSCVYRVTMRQALHSATNSATAASASVQLAFIDLVDRTLRPLSSYLCQNVSLDAIAPAPHEHR